MATMQFSSSQYDKKHIKGLSKRERSLSVLFSEFCKEVAVIGATTGFRDAKKEFYLSSYPAAQRAMKRLLAQLASDITNVVHTGNIAAWEVSEYKNKALLQQVGRNITLPKHLQERVKQGSVNALAAFEERKVNGMNLSKLVWNLVQPLQGQMELALELGLSEGKGAASLSRDVRQYLLNPDKLFRRVRGKDGILRLSKAAAAYHPGQGVYRSSYKNALRMTVTENNMAYRSADYAQWEEMPFVIGTEIGLSNNHPIVDICDELAGVYPKDFKFVGWHPFCRCFATPKLADRSEVNKWARMTDEERKGYKFKGTVDELPKQFNTWVKDNTERIAKATSMPYFIKDNVKFLPESFVDSIGRNAASDLLAIKAGKLRDALFAAKDPNYITDEQITQTLKNFANANPECFNGGLKDVTIMRRAEGFTCNIRHYFSDGTYNKSKGNIIGIADIDFKIDGRTFNPAKELRGAFAAILRKEDMTFNQEYALEAIWHEIRHASARGWNNVNNKNRLKINAMEVINQFCARMSYRDFVHAIGGKTQHHKAVLLNGYGYRQSLSNFYVLLDKIKVSKIKAYNYFNDIIIKHPYEDIENLLISFIESNSTYNYVRATEIVHGLDIRKDTFIDLIS